MLEWNDKFSVAISMIDEEHKKLIGILNKVVFTKGNNSNPEELREVLREMAKYALKHFKTEETYMKELNYPGYQNHKKEHEDFFDKTLEYFHKAGNEYRHILHELHEYLTQWLVNHIQVTDRKYIDCFKKNGLI